MGVRVQIVNALCIRSDVQLQFSHSKNKKTNNNNTQTNEKENGCVALKWNF